MYSRILDAVDLAEVIAAAPQVRDFPVFTAREMVRWLRHLMETEESVEQHVGEDGVFYEMTHKDLARLMGVTPNLVGEIVGDLGLEKQRTRDGYHFFFNKDQVVLLEKALNLTTAVPTFGTSELLEVVDAGNTGE